MPVFQALRLLNNTIDEGVSVKDEAIVMSRDKDLCCKLG